MRRSLMLSRRQRQDMSTNRHISTFQILSRCCHKLSGDNNNVVDAQLWCREFDNSDKVNMRST